MTQQERQQLAAEFARLIEADHRYPDCTEISGDTMTFILKHGLTIAAALTEWAYQDDVQCGALEEVEQARNVQAQLTRFKRFNRTDSSHG